MPTKKKRLQLEHIESQMNQAKAMVFTDYRGLSVAQLQTLRRALAVHNASFEVTKNTLAILAAKKADQAIPDEVLSGPTGTLFAFGDEVAPLKALVDFAKEAELPTIKAGLLGHMFMSKDQVVALAALPSRDMLLAQAVGSIKAPLSGMVNVLQGNLRGLVYALAAVRDQKA